MLSNSYTRYYRHNGSYPDSSTTDQRTDSAFSLTFSWEVTDQDVVYGKSTVSWRLTATALDFTKIDPIRLDAEEPCAYIILGTEAVSPTGVPRNDIVISINGTTVHSTTSMPLVRLNSTDKNKLVTSGTFTITHDADGTFTNKEFACDLQLKNAYDANGVYYFGAGDLGRDGYGKLRITDRMTLTDIPKHAVILTKDDLKVKDFNDEEASVAINYAMPSGMSAQIYLSLDGNANTESTHLATVTNEGTHNYSFTDTDRRKLWALLDQGLDNKQVRFFIKSTGEDGTIFREPSNWVNLRIVNYMPTLNPTVVDSNPISKALTGDQEKLIRYVSIAKFSTGAQAKKHYSIATQSCANGGGNPVYGATGEIPNVASNYFTFTATDNAGRRVQTGLEVPEEYGYWIPYVKLTCSATPTEMTADGDVSVTITGKYFNGNFSTTRPNKMYLSYTLSKNNEDPVTYSRGVITPQVDGSDYTYTFIITGLEYLSVYDLSVKVSDEILTEGTVAHTILASTPIFDWGRTDFNFNVPVTIQGGLVPAIEEQGTHYSGWNYRKWSDGLYECWQRKAVSARLTTASSASGWYTSGAMSGTNLSYPIEFVEIPTVNVSLSPTTNTWAFVVPGSTAGSTSQTGAFQLLATYTHDTNRDYIFNYQVKGRWK